MELPRELQTKRAAPAAALPFRKPLRLIFLVLSSTSDLRGSFHLFVLLLMSCVFSIEHSILLRLVAKLAGVIGSAGMVSRYLSRLADAFSMAHQAILSSNNLVRKLACC